MPFEIVQNDVARMRVDVIVNTANPAPVIGGGTDAAVHSAAGPELLEARRQIGAIRPGCCAVTPAYDLRAKYVIHTVGPVWRGGSLGESRILRRCYDRSLKLAASLGAGSIAFPLISSGTYDFPKEKALKIALAAFRRFLTENEMQIYLVVWDKESVRLSEQVHRNVKKYVDEHYVEVRTEEEYREGSNRRARRRAALKSERPEGHGAAGQSMPRPSSHAPMSCAGFYDSDTAAESDECAETALTELLRHTDAGFSETLMKLIDRSGMTDAAVYRRANLTRQHFSKIRSNPDYRPTKATALALAVALELDLEQTKDLIGRAGYALSSASKFDLIVSYFISRKRYDLYEINAALFEFDQLTLGAS